LAGFFRHVLEVGWIGFQLSRSPCVGKSCELASPVYALTSPLRSVSPLGWGRRARIANSTGSTEAGGGCPVARGSVPSPRSPRALTLLKIDHSRTDLERRRRSRALFTSSIAIRKRRDVAASASAPFSPLRSRAIQRSRRRLPQRRRGPASGRDDAEALRERSSVARRRARSATRSARRAPCAPRSCRST